MTMFLQCVVTILMVELLAAPMACLAQAASPEAFCTGSMHGQDLSRKPLACMCFKNESESGKDDVGPIHLARLITILGQARTLPLQITPLDQNQKSVDHAATLVPDGMQESLSASGIDPDKFAISTLWFAGTPSEAEKAVGKDVHSIDAFDDAAKSKAFLDTVNASELNLDKLELETADGPRRGLTKTILVTVPETQFHIWPPSSKRTFAVVACPLLTAGRIEPIAFLSSITVSNRWWAMGFTALTMTAIYGLIAGLVFNWSAGRAGSPGQNRLRIHWTSALNPVVITQDSYGFGSVSRLQLLCFTLLVAGALLYVQLRADHLAGISTDILQLLGISAAGTVTSAAVASARASDAVDLTFRTDRWLTRHGISIPPRLPRIKDLVMSGQGLDIYKFQVVVFSLLVIVWMLRTALYQLDQATLPINLGYLLGISQAVYVAGKLLGSGQEGMSALNGAVDAAIRAEQDFLNCYSPEHRVRQQALQDALNSPGPFSQPSKFPDAKPGTSPQAAFSTFQTKALCAVRLACNLYPTLATIPFPTGITPLDLPDDTAGAAGPITQPIQPVSSTPSTT